MKLAVLLERRQNIALLTINGVNMARYKLGQNDPYYATDRAELNAWHTVPGKEWHPSRRHSVGPTQDIRTAVEHLPGPLIDRAQAL